MKKFTNKLRRTIYSNNEDNEYNHQINDDTSQRIKQSYHSPDDNYPTATSDEQHQVEDSLHSLYSTSPTTDSAISFYRSAHISYCFRALEVLPSSYSALDASRTWMIYWLTHSLTLLNISLPDSLCDRILSFLSKCQNQQFGGFGGGPQQYPHLATTYASVNTLAIISTSKNSEISKKAFELINRKTMKSFLLSLKNPDGSFRVCANGECDTRGVYTALSIASLLNLISDVLIDNSILFLKNCQTYEGGFGGEPGNEAHGGYTFCGLAAYLIIKAYQKTKKSNNVSNHTNIENSMRNYNSSQNTVEDNSINYPSSTSIDDECSIELNINSLRRWCCHRQLSYELGFQGRTNKLVDACYSYWVGALLPLLEIEHKLHHSNNQTHSSFNSLNPSNSPNLSETLNSLDQITSSSISSFESISISSSNSSSSSDSWLFDCTGLHRYLLICCQELSGGFKDKPGKYVDLYHTCYSLSGLSIAQYNLNGENILFGNNPNNQLENINPIYNLRYDCADSFLKYFSKQLNQ